MYSGKKINQPQGSVVTDDLPMIAVPVPPLASGLAKRDAKFVAIALLKSKKKPVAEGKS